MDIVRLLSDLLTNTVFKLMAPNSTSMVMGMANQIVNMLKKNFKDDIREFMKKLAVGVVLCGVGTAAIISSFRMAEEIIRPMQDGPVILLVSYIVISFLCVGGIFFLFKKEKTSLDLKAQMKSSYREEQRSARRPEHRENHREDHDMSRESDDSSNYSNAGMDVQSALKTVLHAFTESFAESYKKSEKDSDFRSSKRSAVDADGDIRNPKAYEDVETPYYKRPYASDTVSNSRK